MAAGSTSMLMLRNNFWIVITLLKAAASNNISVFACSGTTTSKLVDMPQASAPPTTITASRTSNALDDVDDAIQAATQASTGDTSALALAVLAALQEQPSARADLVSFSTDDADYYNQLDALDAQVEAAIKQFVGKTDDEDAENSVTETECPAESVDLETFASEEPAPAPVEPAKAA